MGVSPDFKQRIHACCISVVSQRIDALGSQLTALAESVANETKSTAGDKYETARAMLHIEQDQVRRQLGEAREQLGVLRGIDPSKTGSVVALGSLIDLSGDLYFLSTALGRLRVDGSQVIALSLQSPLGARLRGLSAGDTFALNGKQHCVIQVC